MCRAFVIMGCTQTHSICDCMFLRGEKYLAVRLSSFDVVDYIYHYPQSQFVLIDDFTHQLLGFRVCQIAVKQVEVEKAWEEGDQRFPLPNKLWLLLEQARADDRYDSALAESIMSLIALWPNQETSRTLKKTIMTIA